MFRPTRPGSADQPLRRRPRAAQPKVLSLGGALAVGAVLILSGCGGSSAGGSGTSNVTASPSGAAESGAPTPGRGRGPAASGEIAAVSGATMQVQSQQNGQVAVSWTSATKFTQQVSVAAKSLKVGDCVMAVAASGTSSGATSFTATTVSVTATATATATGSCDARGGGGFGGTRPSGGNGGTPPSGFPSGVNPPSGFPSGGAGARAGGIAVGSVVSVSGSDIVVAARDFTPGSTSGSSPATTNKTITLTSSTKITGTQSATANAVRVGRCASAQGETDSSGSVSATSIAITDPVNGTCSARFGFPGGGAPNGAGS
jgi:hypothetical protein